MHSHIHYTCTIQTSCLYTIHNEMSMHFLELLNCQEVHTLSKPLPSKDQMWWMRDGSMCHIYIYIASYIDILPHSSMQCYVMWLIMTLCLYKHPQAAHMHTRKLRTSSETHMQDIIRDTHAGEELEVLRTGVYVTASGEESIIFL